MNEFIHNEATNHALMVHVERIVKPVSATQGRKLQMRTELLAHLHATLEEERRAAPGDEQTAIERAKLRLGESAELSAKLQHTVPALERLLLTKVPASPRFERVEQKMAQLPGKRGPMTLGHITTLAGTALLVFVPLMISMLSALKSVGMQTAHPAVAAIGILFGWMALILASYRFVFEAANSDYPFKGATALGQGITVMALQIGLTFFLAFSVADRTATISEVATGTASTLAFLVISVLVGRCVAVLRRPYDEWLTLKLAE